MARRASRQEGAGGVRGVGVTKRVDVDPEVLEAIRSRGLEASEVLVEVIARKRDEAEGEREERFRAGMKAGGEMVADMLKNTLDRIGRCGWWERVGVAGGVQGGSRAGMKAGAEIVADMVKNTCDRISRFGL